MMALFYNIKSKTIGNLMVCLMLLLSLEVKAQHRLIKVWESEPTLAVPESVLPVPGGLYVSLVDGQALEADGKGAIAKLDLNGKIINASWVTGLNGPKGMGIWKNRLYVADISQVVVIDTTTGKIETRITIPGAKGLNDLTIDAKGTIYISDSELGNIISIRDGKPSVYMSGLPGANGLTAIGKRLYVLTDEHVYRSSAKTDLISLTSIPKKGADGIAAVGNGDFLFTIYSGLIYYLDRLGKKQVLLDTEAQGKSSADIGYDPVGRLVFVPTLFHKSVVAYRLE